MRHQALQSNRGLSVLRWLRVRPDDFGFGRLFERVADAVVVADVDTGAIVLWNPAAAAMFGYAAEAIVGQPIEVLMPARMRERHAAGMRHFRETGHGRFIDAGRPMELPACTREGREFPIELTLSPLQHPSSGRLYVLALIRDISERWEARRAAERLALVGLAGLAANEAPSADAAAAQIIEAVCRREGFEVGHLYVLAGEAERPQPSTVWHLAEPALEAFRAFTESTPIAAGSGLPGRVQAAGEVVWLEDLAGEADFPRRSGALEAGLSSAVGVPVRVGEGVVGALEFFSREPRVAEAALGDALAQVGVQLGRAYEREWAAAERQRLNATLEERVEARTAELAIANRELEAFSYSVSHDLRAPLRALDGFSQIVLEDYADSLPEQGQAYLRMIRDASQQMARLIDDLLRLSRVSRVELHMEAVDLSALASEKLAELQAETPRPDVQVDVAEGCLVWGDRPLLKLLVSNLLENAWKFTGKTPGAHITFGCEEREGEVVYHVRDDGVGFDMAYVEKLFKPFSRLHKAEEFDGTGIGLATVQRVVSRHGGRAWAEAAPGKGATFFFTVPDRGRRRAR